MGKSAIHGLLALALLGAVAEAGAQGVLVGRLTTTGAGLQLNAGASDPAISSEGLHIAFVSTSSNLGQASNGFLNVYVYDLVTDQYVLATSVLGNGNSFAPSVAAGGGALAFESLATNLAPNGASTSDVYYSESFTLPQGEIAYNTYLVSRGLGGAPPNDSSRHAAISADGQFVAFYSDASNLIAGDSNGAPDIFVGSASTLFGGAPQRVSVDDSGGQINGPSRALTPAALSGNGRYVAFAVDTPVSIDGSNAGTLEDVFVRDRTAGTTRLMSRSSAGVAGNSSSDSAAISPSGRYVVFRSFASNLVASPSGSRIYVRDREANTTFNMPLPPGAASCEDPRVSDVGDIVAQCNMNASIPAQAFLYRPGGGFIQLSTSTTNGTGDGPSGNYTSISADGYFLAFDSSASNLVASDTNNNPDVFVGVDEEILNLVFADGFE